MYKLEARGAFSAFVGLAWLFIRQEYRRIGKW